MDCIGIGTGTSYRTQAVPGGEVRELLHCPMICLEIELGVWLDFAHHVTTAPL